MPSNSKAPNQRGSHQPDSRANSGLSSKAKNAPTNTGSNTAWAKCMVSPKATTASSMQARDERGRECDADGIGDDVDDSSGRTS